MKKIVVCVIILLFTMLENISAQRNSDAEKKFAKAGKLLDEGKPEDAEKILIELSDAYPYSPAVWNKLVQVQLKIYEDKVENDKLFKGLSFSAKDSEGKDIQNDTLLNTLKSVLGSFKPSDSYKSRIIYNCRKACCYTREAFYSAIIIRNFTVDEVVDKGVLDAAWKQFQLAEKEFMAKNYNGAAKYYKKAIDIDPTFYRAKLYLGDVYYHTKRYDLAIKSFKEAIETRPDLLEPRKYLVDALANSNAYEKAYEAAIEAIMIYPDNSMMMKLEEIAKLAEFPINQYWVSRDVFPNKRKEVAKSEEDTPMQTSANSPWLQYKVANENVKEHVNNEGILSTNKITNQKYLEVYSWEYMLNNSDVKLFSFARKMEEMGFLDCYALVTNFHNDFYDQYKDFVTNNSDKIKKYYDLLKTIN